MGMLRFLDARSSDLGVRALPVSTRTLLGVVLGAGLLLRLVLAFVVAPGQGFASDLQLFGHTAQSLAAQGPGSFYAGGGLSDYPPAYLWVLWALGELSRLGGSVLGIAQGDVLVALLKLPAILADVGVAALLFRIAGRWLGPRAGLAAAALYLFIPVTWYDSALWGQVDAVDTLVMVAALALLIEGWSEAAAVVAIMGVLVKPQALICLAVVAPILLRRHLLAVGSGPTPALGPRLQRLNGLLRGLLVRQGPIRLVSSALAATAVGLLVMAPFDISAFASPALARIPAVGQVAGLVGLIRSASGEYAVLSANAYNAWALVGPHPLALGMGWTPDSLSILGLPAVVVGTALLVAMALLVAGGLLLRDGRLPIVLGFTLLAFAFFATPTRSHERYLFPVFAAGVILASAALARAAAYVVTGLLYTLNLNAVLSAPLALGSRFAGGGAGQIRKGGGPVTIRGGPPRGIGHDQTIGGPGGGPGHQQVIGGPGGPGGLSVSGIHLPLADFSRTPFVATTVSVALTAALLGLLAAWIATVIGWRPGRARRAGSDAAA